MHAEHRSPWLTLAKIVFLWLCAVLVLGSGALLGPMNLVAEQASRHGWVESAEKGLLVTVVVLTVAASTVATVLICRPVLVSRQRHVRTGILLLALLAAVSTVLIWLTPPVPGSRHLERITTVLLPGTDGTAGENEQATGRVPDNLRGRRMFERGRLFVPAEDLYLTPFPTDEEFARYILTGDWGMIVCLMDPSDPGDRTWILKERELLERYDVPFEVITVPADLYDPEAVLAAARRIWTMPRPVLVHSFLSPLSGKSSRADAVFTSLMTGLPPLPQLLLDAPMKQGLPWLLAPNVMAGPTPEGPEFGTYLYRRGIRQVLYLGDPESEEAVRGMAGVMESPLGWNAVQPDQAPGWIGMLATGGPWYLYGPRLEEVEYAITERYGPPVPEVAGRNREFLLAGLPLPPDRQKGGKPLIPLPAWLDSFFGRLLPNTAQVVLAGPPLLLLATLAAWLAGWLRVSKQVAAPYTRKLFHFVIFTLAGVLHVAGGPPMVVLFGCLVSIMVLYAVYRGEGFPFYEAMARPSDAPHGRMFIVIPLMTTVAGGLIVNFLFAPFAYIGYLVSGWGDALGEPVGTAWGRHRYRVPSLGGVYATRSFEGSAAVLAAGFLAAFLGLLAGGIGPGAALGVALACALAGGIVEAVSNHGVDNLTVQVASAYIAWLLLA